MTIYDKGCISNYRNCSLCYVCYSVLYRMLTEKQLSVKEMIAAVGLRDRPNFIEYSLSPAMREGYVRMLYPDSPRHPRQKYLLTVKGLAAYKELSR